jgi:ribosome biogenesis GTPase
VIVHIEPRKSVLSRADPLSQKKEQYIAANIDQVLITLSVVNPPLKAPIVDRYIIASERGGMVPVIIVNKVDLLASASDDEKVVYNEFLRAYRQAGFTVIPVSAETGEGLDILRDAMAEKASVFSGPSGTGKSSLINAMTGTTLPVGRTVGRTKKGAHTTTKAHLVPLEFGGWCIDTPGVKSFGVWDLKAEEIAPYFPEIYELGRSCKYPDCQHIQEEGCAVQEGVNDGTISPIRYGSYCYLVLSVKEKHVKR